MSNKPVEDELQELRNEFLEEECDAAEQDKSPTEKFIENPLPPLSNGDAVAIIGGIIEVVGDVIIGMLEG